MKRLLALSALLMLVGTIPLRADDASPPKPIVVPFELLKTGHMTVMVKIEGKGPYKLIFDTGAPINLINNKIAKESGLLKGAKKPAFALFGTMGDVKIKTLQVGDQQATNVPAIVMDHPTVEAISRAFGPIDGIVGFPFFARFKMTLDYQAKTMTLVPNGFKPPDVMMAMQTALMSALSSDGAPIVLSSQAQFGMTVHKESKDEEAGVTIKSIHPGSPAEKSGLQVGDRLLTLDDRWTDTVNDTYTAASFVKPGSTVVLKIVRKGKEMMLKITPKSGL